MYGAREATLWGLGRRAFYNTQDPCLYNSSLLGLCLETVTWTIPRQCRSTKEEAASLDQHYISKYHCTDAWVWLHGAQYVHSVPSINECSNGKVTLLLSMGFTVRAGMTWNGETFPRRNLRANRHWIISQDCGRERDRACWSCRYG